MQASEVFANIRDVSAQFAAERSVRQRRRELTAVDFGQLREAGFLLTGAPTEEGGSGKAYNVRLGRSVTCSGSWRMPMPRSHWSARCIPPC